MSFLEAITLGILQGLTEFLPVSSSAHLVVLPQIFGWGDHPLFFDTTLHFGTSLALLVYFWRDLWKVVTHPQKWWLRLFIGMLPAGILGLFLNDLFESYFRRIGFAILFLVFGSILMWVAERFSKLEGSIDKVSPKKSFLIGTFQSLALFPGFSRSGSTISGGMLLGLSRKAAARFSFLLSIPLVWAAALFELKDVSTVSFSTSLVVGTLASFLTGLLCIKFFMRFVEKYTLKPFIAYRLIFAVLLLLFVLS